MVKGKGIEWDGDGVRALRRHMRLTQHWLAEELGTRQQTVSEWETGLYKPRGSSAKLLTIIAERAGFDYRAAASKKGNLPMFEAKGAGEIEGKVDLKLHLGDIAELEVDAMINAASDGLVREEPIPVGEAVIAAASKLKARYVIHAAVMDQDLKTDAAKIRAATKNSLLRAEELGIKSIAFSPLGTGAGGFPLEECIKIMISVVQEHISGETGLEEVVFALFSDKGDQRRKVT